MLPHMLEDKTEAESLGGVLQSPESHGGVRKKSWNLMIAPASGGRHTILEYGEDRGTWTYGFPSSGEQVRECVARSTICNARDVAQSSRVCGNCGFKMVGTIRELSRLT